MERAGHLCFSAVSSSKELVYSQSSSQGNRDHLVFFKEQGDRTLVTFAWENGLSDLDICAYWVGASDYTFGFDQRNANPPSPYSITWSRDKTGPGESEWCNIWKSNWRNGSNVFRVHFNYFVTVPEGKAAVCTVIANQKGGATKILKTVSCNNRTKAAASKNDPYIDVTFDGSGMLQGITAHEGG